MPGMPVRPVIVQGLLSRNAESALGDKDMTAEEGDFRGEERGIQDDWEVGG